MPRGEFDRSARKAATRERLLQAAATVYAKNGFAGATLDDVAREAGLTKGAVYDHFGSKDNLLVALMTEYLGVEISSQVAWFDRDEVTWRRPIAGSDGWMKELDESPDAFRLLVEFWLAAGRDEDVREQFLLGLNALRDTFAGFTAMSATDAGVPMSPDSANARNFANVVLGLSLGLGLLRVADPEGTPAGVLGTALSTLIQTLEADPAARAAMAEPDVRSAT